MQPSGAADLPPASPRGPRGLCWRPYLVCNGTAKFVLSVHVAEHEGRVALALEYRHTVDAVELGWLAELMAACVADVATGATTAAAWRLGRVANGQLVVAAARGKSTVPQHRRVEEAFFATAATHPDRPAVIEDTSSGVRAFTYGEVAAAAGSLAEVLKTAGAGSGRAVGVCLPRGSQVVAAAHAVLRAGGVLLLVDPDLPPARREFMLADSRAVVLVEPAEDFKPSRARAGERRPGRTQPPRARGHPAVGSRWS